MPDNMNTPQTQPLTVEESTLTSIHFSWEKWTGDTADPNAVSYQIWMTEEENPADPWRLVKEGKGLHTWTLKDLKSDTGYGILVKAIDNDVLVCQYPELRGCLTVRTKAPDTLAPTVKNSAIKVTATSYNSISIAWEPATDNATEQNKIRYKVWLKHNGAPSRAWRAVEEKKGIPSFTFTDLTLNTKYDFYIEAFDEVGNVLRYPDAKSYKTASTLADTTAPAVKNNDIKVIGITRNSISIKWDPALDDITPKDKIRYQVWLSLYNDPNDTWKKVEDQYGISSYTFKGLKEGTEYAFQIRAFDEVGNALVYPGRCATEAPDTTAPSVKSRAINVTGTTRNSISIKWEPATDNVTQQSKILYRIWLFHEGVDSNWRKIDEKAGISSYTFNNLKEASQYGFYIEAIDEAGNVLKYPLDNGCMTARTASADAVAPTVKNRDIKVTGKTRNSISIQWEPATDNVTQQSKILYRIYLFQPGVDNYWRKVAEKAGISSYTFNNLKEASEYDFYIDALDEVGNVLKYPLDNGCMSARTTSADAVAPSVKNRDIKVTGKTRNSISIQWEPATDNVTQQSKILYRIYLFQPGVDNYWRKVAEKAGISSYTFNNLKEASEYDFYIDALDEAGNVLKYPLDNGCMSARTTSSDAVAPTVKSRDIKVTGTTRNSISIQWEPATDNVTQQSKILYRIYLFQPGVDNYWRKVAEKAGISSYTFNNLKEASEYDFYIDALDEAGNVLKYPLDNGCMSAKTKAPGINKLSVSIKQNATVLTGSETLALELTYNYVRYNANGVVSEMKSGSWQNKWKNQSAASTVITLPENWYFENNRVLVRIRSRKGVAAGLNTWRTSHEGYVDISKGTLNLTLTGSILSQNVKFTVNP